MVDLPQLSESLSVLHHGESWAPLASKHMAIVFSLDQISCNWISKALLSRTFLRCRILSGSPNSLVTSQHHAYPLLLKIMFSCLFSYLWQLWPSSEVQASKRYVDNQLRKYSIMRPWSINPKLPMHSTAGRYLSKKANKDQCSCTWDLASPPSLFYSIRNWNIVQGLIV